MTRLRHNLRITRGRKSIILLRILIILLNLSYKTNCYFLKLKKKNIFSRIHLTTRLSYIFSEYKSEPNICYIMWESVLFYGMKMIDKRFCRSVNGRNIKVDLLAANDRILKYFLIKKNIDATGFTCTLRSCCLCNIYVYVLTIGVRRILILILIKLLKRER